MKQTVCVWICILILPSALYAQKVDYSVTVVPKEAGMEITRITNDNDRIAMPLVRRKPTGIQWVTGRILDISPNGKLLAFISIRDQTTNVYVKEIGWQNSSIKRTNRTAVMDLSFSPDGKYICFSEEVGKTRQIFQTDVSQGFVCRQFTSGSIDYNPVYSPDMTKVFFSRKESQDYSIWSYDLQENYLSNYTSGLNPAFKSNGVLLCSRPNALGKGEIWIIDFNQGTEECIVSDPTISFSSPALSPDGEWVAIVGGTPLTYIKHTGRSNNIERTYWNTDIYLCKTDGSDLGQITFHAADDLCPIWSRDGQYIYFISQRGSENATANIWRMTITTNQ